MSIIRTKLHRPPIHRVHLHRQRLIDRLDQSIQRPLTLVLAPAGYGKTTLVSWWLETSDNPSAWVCLDETDNDLRQFLRYFLTALQSIFPDAGQQTLAMVNALTLPPVSVLAGNLVNEIDRIEHPFVLVLDDFQHIKGGSVIDLLTQFLRHPPQALHLVLIGRRDPSLPISALRAQGLVTEIRTQDLRFNEVETATYLTQVLGRQVDASTAAALAEKTEGWVTGLHLATLSMRHRGNLDPSLLESQVNAQYVMEYLFTEVFSRQPPEFNRYLLGTAILDRFCATLCEVVCLPGVDKCTCESGGWEFIAWLKQENMFLIPLDAEKRWFRFHHLLKKMLFNQLKRHFSSEDINDLHAKASAWFAENGLIEEALNHALVGGNPATAARLVVRHGFDLLNEEQWPRLEKWLGMLPDDMVGQDPELLVLFSWLHVIYSRYPELASCLNKADALLSDRTTSEPIRGHLDALHCFQQNLSANGERGLTYARRASGTLPRNHRWARVFAYINRALAHQMLGERAKALAVIEETMRDPDLGGGISQGYFQASPCFIYWMEADLPAILQSAVQSLKAVEGFQAHQAIAHGLYFMGIALYHRNELQAAEEKLAEAVKHPYSQHAWNYAHSAFALALIYQARGRTDEANQVGESVISYGLDSSNPVVLRVARAFQAELALRQGRLAGASHWAEQFVAKPFVLMYRGYVPQLTLVKVLLAQDTTASREQAADLLKQLYDFVTYSHDKRFLIEVLALQALLHDTRDETSAALEKLTEALHLAEHGGFIRLFVDLGPQMADLLKDLIKHNIAVDYIMRILTAFREDAHNALPDASDSKVPPPHHLLSPFPRPAISQPSGDPLTNREVDVLALLTQRLTNKEIAVKLFIAPETVKKHLYNIYGKLNVSSRLQATKKARKLHIV